QRAASAAGYRGQVRILDCGVVSVEANHGDQAARRHERLQRNGGIPDGEIPAPPVLQPPPIGGPGSAKRAGTERVGPRGHASVRSGRPEGELLLPALLAKPPPSKGEEPRG